MSQAVAAPAHVEVSPIHTPPLHHLSNNNSDNSNNNNGHDSDISSSNYTEYQLFSHPWKQSLMKLPLSKKKILPILPRKMSLKRKSSSPVSSNPALASALTPIPPPPSTSIPSFLTESITSSPIKDSYSNPNQNDQNNDRISSSPIKLPSSMTNTPSKQQQQQYQTSPSRKKSVLQIIKNDESGQDLQDREHPWILKTSPIDEDETFRTPISSINTMEPTKDQVEHISKKVTQEDTQNLIASVDGDGNADCYFILTFKVKNIFIFFYVKEPTKMLFFFIV